MCSKIGGLQVQLYEKIEAYGGALKLMSDENQVRKMEELIDIKNRLEEAWKKLKDISI